MVYYDHDVLDDMYDVDKYYVYYDGETTITTSDAVFNLESCCLQTKHEVYYGATADGTDVEIPVSDVISLKGTVLYKGAAAWFQQL